MNPTRTFSQRWMLPFVVAFALWALADLFLVQSQADGLWKDLQTAVQTQLQQFGLQVFAQVHLAVLGTLVGVLMGYLLIFDNPRSLQWMTPRGQIVSVAPIVVFPRMLSWSIGLVWAVHAAFKGMVCLNASSQVLASFSEAELHFIQPWVYSDLLQFLSVDVLLLIIFHFLTRSQRIPAPVTATQP